MYQIYADNTLIYDGTLDEYRIGKGQITLETDKSGSFTFTVFPDHFYYNQFVKLRTVITVYKSGKIVFRGRILTDKTDYFNNKVLTCEGEFGFFQDSIIRPFEFGGTPEELFRYFIDRHNAQVDEFKQFRIGTVTVVDDNDYIARSNESYESTLSNMNSRLLESSAGGHFFITHGDDGRDPIPTIHYLAEFTHVATQPIEFGENLKDYVKTTRAEEIATAIIPLGAQVMDENAPEVLGDRLTIASVNDGIDYIFDQEAVALRGWVFKTVIWEDVTVAANLKRKAEDHMEKILNESINLQLTAVDMHMLDRNIESYCICDLVPVSSPPHNFEGTMLCNRQTMDLLKPDNDTISLGATYKTASSIRTEDQQKSRKTYSQILKSNEQIRAEVKNDVKQLSAALRVELGRVAVEVNEQGDKITRLQADQDAITTEVSFLEGDLTRTSQTVDGLTVQIQTAEGDLLLVKQTIEGVTVTGKDGETLIAGGSIETETLRLSKLIAANDSGNYVVIENDGLSVYNSQDVQKIRLGFTAEDNEYPFIQLGAGTEDDYAGIMKKFDDGLWIGNAAPAEASGDFQAAMGYNGIFINLETNIVYVVHDTNMANMYTGDAIARFA